MKALIDKCSEVNVMHPTYTTKLGLYARKIDVSAQKINRFYPDIFGIVISDYSVKNRLKRVRFFPETYLLANISLKVVLEMLFLIFGKTKIRFAEQELVWRTYIDIETLPTTRSVEIFNKREFAVAALKTNNKTFIMYIAALPEPTTMPIYLFCQAQVTSLMSKKIGIPAKYSDFSNVFYSDSAAELT